MAVMPHGDADTGEAGLVAGLAADPVAGGVARWASQRGLAPAVVTGAGVGLALVAAVWFSGQAPLARAAAAVALLTSLVASRAARMLAAPVQARAPVAGWLMTGCWALSEWTVYAGLAASAGLGAGPAPGAHAVHGGGRPGAGAGGVWQLAAAAMLLLAVRQMADLCYERAAEGADGRPRRSRLAWLRWPWLRWPWLRLAGRSLTLPSGERAVLIAVTGAVWGPAVTFPALLGWGSLALGCVLVARIAAGRGAAAGEGAAVVAGAGTATGSGAGPGSGGGASQAAPAAGEGADGGQIAACRDDGRVSQWLGGLAGGRLPPLPPVIAGVLVTAVLAALGLGHLTGILVLTPVEAMLLAGLGARHPHDGPLDWLVPPLLQAGEYLFLAALAFTRPVPPPLAFALLAAVALRHLDAACRARYRVVWPVPSRAPRRAGHPGSASAWYAGSSSAGYAGSKAAVYAGAGYARAGRPAVPAVLPPEAGWAGLGWEVRMLVAGLAGAFGVVTFACVMLSGYLWFLLG
ncbi:MAG TPA: DUF5941 domain-containing protein, partial [Streptosporangiaceae bacterium]|nr:DUF5941 domain-containing protein [Streptosporangiaceae bacterium]